MAKKDEIKKEIEKIEDEVENNENVLKSKKINIKE